MLKFIKYRALNVEYGAIHPEELQHVQVDRQLSF